MKKLSVKLLKMVETFFLRCHGWKKVGKDEWNPPPEYGEEKKDRVYRGGHAVNSQKYHNHSAKRFGGDHEGSSSRSLQDPR